MFAPFSRTVSVRDTIGVTLHVALEHHDRNELQEAAALYREILGIDPEHADSLFLLGMIANAGGDVQAAEQLLRAAVRNRPGAAHMHQALAEALMKANRSAAALQCYWRFLALEPENPIAYVQVGDALRAIKPEGGNDPLAASCYRRALVIDPVCAMAHYGLGKVFRNAQDLKQAKTSYQSAIAADPGKSVFHAALGEVLHALGQYGWAADAYRRAIQLKPQSSQLLHRLGDALSQLGQTERAEACHLRAKALQAGRIRVGQKGETAQKSAGNLRAWSDRYRAGQPPVRTLVPDAEDAKGAVMAGSPPSSGSLHEAVEGRTA